MGSSAKRGCFTRGDFNAESFRGIVMGTTLATCLSSVLLYQMVVDSVKVGQLPGYTGDLFITCMAGLEVILAPFISWIGYTRRLRMIKVYQFLGLVLLITVLFLPSAGNVSSNFCDPSASVNDSEITTATITRLAVLSCLALVYLFIGVGTWCHGLAKMDEYASETSSINFGVVMCSKVLGLLIGPFIVGDLSEGITWSNIMLLLIIYFAQHLLLWRVKEESQEDEALKPKISENDREFGKSLIRVLSNRLVMIQALSIAFLATALWGFSYNETSFVKTVYNHVRDDTVPINYADVLRYHAVVASVVLLGILYKKPMMLKYQKKEALGTVIKVTVICIIMYVAMAVFSCNKGSNAGIVGDTFTQPACSNNCGCASRSEFFPVCISDELVTYASPCHAGCSTTERVEGLLSYTNCTCSSSGRATVGGCNERSCAGMFGLHDLLFSGVTLFSILAFMTQVVLIMRAVDPRDRSVALGVCSSIVALIAFVIGTMVFYAIRTSTCLWHEGSTCQLQMDSYQHWIGGLSASSAFLSLVITILTLIFNKQTLVEEETEEIQSHTNGLVNTEL